MIWNKDDTFLILFLSWKTSAKCCPAFFVATTLDRCVNNYHTVISISFITNNLFKLNCLNFKLRNAVEVSSKLLHRTTWLAMVIFRVRLHFTKFRDTTKGS